MNHADLDPVVLECDPVRILRFGAATHNAHRIHYDDAYPGTEGLEGPVVMAQLVGTLFHRAAASVAGRTGRVSNVRWQNRAPAYVGAVVTVTGRAGAPGDDGTIVIELEARTDTGVLCAVGGAVVGP